MATEIYHAMLAGAPTRPDVEHPQQTFAQIGARVPKRDVQALRSEVVRTATNFGFPGTRTGDLVPFDFEAAVVVRRSMDLSWSEAASREVWNFIALVVLPDVTLWRWRDQPRFNVERWVATDLTRHTWARLWWRAVAFEDAPELFPRLSESDLNQLLERRSIGGNPDLLIAMVRSVLAKSAEAEHARRLIFRDATKRLRRLLAFIDDLALTKDQLQTLTDSVVDDTLAHLKSLEESD